MHDRREGEAPNGMRGCLIVRSWPWGPARARASGASARFGRRIAFAGKAIHCGHLAGPHGHAPGHFDVSRVARMRFNASPAS